MVLPTVSRCENDQSDRSRNSSKSDHLPNERNPDKEDDKRVNHLLNSERELKEQLTGT